MGIDIYLKWKGMTAADQQAQYTGFSTVAGDIGYLREAYHGAPYATRYFVSEAFEYEYDADPNLESEDVGYVPIPAATLRERLPYAVILTIARDMIVYGNDEDVGVFELPPNTSDPVPGELPPEIMPALAKVFGGITTMRGGSIENYMVERTPPELLKMVDARIRARSLPDYALSYVDFCRLAELKEQETGEPVRILASY